MSQLTFPTMAEKALAAFQSATKTISLITICNQMGAMRRLYYANGRVIEYTFDDDSSLEIRGQGKSHRVETFLP